MRCESARPSSISSYDDSISDGEDQIMEFESEVLCFSSLIYDLSLIFTGLARISPPRLCFDGLSIRGQSWHTSAAPAVSAFG